MAAKRLESLEPLRGSSSLESFGKSGHSASGRCAPLSLVPGVPVQWLTALGRETSPFRTRKAEEHTRAADDAQETRRLGLDHKAMPLTCERRPGEEGCGACADCLDRSAVWHRSRAKGQTERFDRALECGSEDVGKTECDCCGGRHAVQCECDVWRVCAHCRAHAALERRARFGQARAAVIQEAAKHGALRRVQKGGAWGEKLVTLTIPHLSWIDVEWSAVPERFRHLPPGPELTLTLRVELIFAAWRHFTRAWQRWWRKRARRGVKARFYRAFEWTPGHDGLGHPHFHVWAFCQYIREDVLRAWWKDALRRAGAIIADDVEVMVDVKAIDTRPNEISRELFKGHKKDAVKLSRLKCWGRGGEAVLEYADGWSVVDMANGERVAPHLAARLYEALEGRHVAHASRGLLPEQLRATCPDCGELGSLSLVIDRTAPQAALQKAFGVGPPAKYANTA